MSVESIDRALWDQRTFDPDRYLQHTIGHARETYPEASDEARLHVAKFVSAFLSGLHSFEHSDFGQRPLIELTGDDTESDELIRRIVIAKSAFIGSHAMYDNGTRADDDNMQRLGLRRKRAAATEHLVHQFTCNSHPEFEIHRIQTYTEDWTPSESLEYLKATDRAERLGDISLKLTSVEYNLNRGSIPLPNQD